MNINIGDIVTISNDGHTYSTYDLWAKKYKLKNYKHGDIPTLEKEFLVVVKGFHLDDEDGQELIGIRNMKTKQEYIYGLHDNGSITFIRKYVKQPEFSF